MQHPLDCSDDLFIRFSSGKSDAFRALHDAYRHRLQYYAMTFSLSKEEAEDIVGDAFTRCWQSHTTFTGMEHVKNFLYIATKNASLNFLNARGRQKIYREKYSSEQQQQEEPFSHDRLESEVLHLIYTGIDTLPPECKRVFQLYLGEYETAEIADMLGISPATVRSHKRRAIQLLKDRIIDKGGPASLIALAMLHGIFNPQ